MSTRWKKIGCAEGYPQMWKSKVEKFFKKFSCSPSRKIRHVEREEGLL
jgi:hypothetical protein